MRRTNTNSGWAEGHWGRAPDLFLPKYRGTPRNAGPNSTKGSDQDAAQKKPSRGFP